MIKLYHSPNSFVIMRTIWALDECGVPHEKILIDQDKDEQKKPDFLKINPNGLLPALVIEDGSTVFESLAIILHIAEKYGVKKGLWPEIGSAAAAAALTWSVWGTVTLNPPLITYAKHASDLHFALPKEQRSPVLAAESEAEIRKSMTILDEWLATRAYSIGDTFSLVDVANAPLVGRAVASTIDLAPYKNITAWMVRCISRPHFTQIMKANSEWTLEARDGKIVMG